MKSMIISAVFGTAILAIHGVTGAVMPLNSKPTHDLGLLLLTNHIPCSRQA